MNRTRRPAYALLYVLAGMPLLIVIGNVTVQILGNALRTQRVATEGIANDDARHRLVDRIRRDALDANSFSVVNEPTRQRLVLSTGTDRVEYVIQGNTIHRASPIDDKIQSQMTWKLRDTECTLQYETITEHRALLWLRFHCTVEFR